MTKSKTKEDKQWLSGFAMKVRVQQTPLREIDIEIAKKSIVRHMSVNMATASHLSRTLKGADFAGLK